MAENLDPATVLNVRYQREKNSVSFEQDERERIPWHHARRRHRDFMSYGDPPSLDHGGLQYVDSDDDETDGTLYDDELDDDFMETFNLDDLLHSLNGYSAEEVLPFQHGEKASGMCQVCYDFATAHQRSCCSELICDECIQQYCITDVKEGILKIPCPIPLCKSYITKDEIVYRLPSDLKVKFNKYLTDANANPCIKTCPRCSHITNLINHAKELQKRKVKKHGLCLCCTECDLKWCFQCQAPWHEGVTCKQFMTGDRLVKDWAQTLHPGSRTKNAVKCPRCKIFIERTEGCDHMHCSKCNTDFCYRCGDKFRSLKFLGNHHDRYSIFGCKYRLKPGKPHERKLIRGAILGGKILALPCVAVVAVGAGAIILVAGAVLGPFYGGYKLHRARKRIKKMKEWRTGMTGHGYHMDNVRTTGIPETPMFSRSTSSNRAARSDGKMENFDDEDEDLEFYDFMEAMEVLRNVQMRRTDLPMLYVGDEFQDKDSYIDSETGLDKWSDDYHEHLYRKGQGYKGWMGRQSLSSDSDTEELDSGVMFVLDSAGKLYSSDNSSLRASKDTIVEYVAAVSETTHL